MSGGPAPRDFEWNPYRVEGSGERVRRVRDAQIARTIGPIQSHIATRVGDIDVTMCARRPHRFLILDHDGYTHPLRRDCVSARAHHLFAGIAIASWLRGASCANRVRWRGARAAWAPLVVVDVRHRVPAAGARVAQRLIGGSPDDSEGSIAAIALGMGPSPHTAEQHLAKHMHVGLQRPEPSNRGHPEHRRKRSKQVLRWVLQGPEECSTFAPVAFAPANWDPRTQVTLFDPFLTVV